MNESGPVHRQVQPGALLLGSFDWPSRASRAGPRRHGRTPTPSIGKRTRTRCRARDGGPAALVDYPYPAFYAYAAPEPPVSPAPDPADGTFYHPEMKIFIYRYDECAPRPIPGALLEFLQTTYEAGRTSRSGPAGARASRARIAPQGAAKMAGNGACAHSRASRTSKGEAPRVRGVREDRQLLVHLRTCQTCNGTRCCIRRRTSTPASTRRHEAPWSVGRAGRAVALLLPG